MRRQFAFIGAALIATAASLQSQTSKVPVATQWVLDAAGQEGRAAVRDVYMIVCPAASQKGTGFLVDSGVVVTNEHVVRGCGASQLIGVSSNGARIAFSALRIDQSRDLAALTPAKPLKGGLRLGSTRNLNIGAMVRTWGFPLGYNGPPPLLSVGYLSGFNAAQVGGANVKHLVVNGAFNSGNSGGPLFAGVDNTVVGIVVAKALPNFTPFMQSAITAFANNQSGVVFTGTDATGKPISLVESQLVAQIVMSVRDMAQVMIGEAVAVEELRQFLESKGSNK